MKKNLIKVFAVILLVFISNSVFAIDEVNLRQNMWKWSSLEAVISESLSFNFGHHYTPVVSIEEAYQEIENARMEVSKIVAGIETAKDMAEARAVAEEFKSMYGHEAEVGKTLHKLLDMQEKYLKIHTGL